MVHYPTMSKSALLMGPCLHWAGPDARWYDESKIKPEDKKKTTDGISFHRRMDSAVKFKTAKQIRFEEFRDPEMGLHFLSRAGKHGKAFIDDLLTRSESLMSEVPVRVHWESKTSEPLPGVTDRGYPEEDGWQCGTCDIVAILRDGRLYVADWKTGSSDGAEQQLLSLAFALQNILLDDFGDKRKVVICTLFVNEEGVWATERNIEQEIIDTHADAMAIVYGAKDSHHEPNPGVHCTALYCPHLAYCKAITSVTGQLAGGTAAEGKPQVNVTDLIKGKRKLTDEPTTDAEAGYTMAVVQAVKRQINYLTEGAKARIKAGGGVSQGDYVWEDRGNGYRWHNNKPKTK